MNFINSAQYKRLHGLPPKPNDITKTGLWQPKIMNSYFDGPILPLFPRTAYLFKNTK